VIVIKICLRQIISQEHIPSVRDSRKGNDWSIKSYKKVIFKLDFEILRRGILNKIEILAPNYRDMKRHLLCLH
jgi:hypothetical protein